MEEKPVNGCSIRRDAERLIPILRVHLANMRFNKTHEVICDRLRTRVLFRAELNVIFETRAVSVCT